MYIESIVIVNIVQWFYKKKKNHTQLKINNEL